MTEILTATSTAGFAAILFRCNERPKRRKYLKFRGGILSVWICKFGSWYRIAFLDSYTHFGTRGRDPDFAAAESRDVFHFGTIHIGAFFSAAG
jgi:hypothetical protein